MSNRPASINSGCETTNESSMTQVQCSKLGGHPPARRWFKLKSRLMVKGLYHTEARNLSNQPRE